MFTPALFTRNNFWRDPFDELNAMFPAMFDDGGLEKSFAGFNTDVMEKDGNYILQAELPGFNKEDIHVDLKNNILSISASYKDGILEVTFPKRDALPEKEAQKIEIK